MLKRVLTFTGTGLMAGALSLVAINHTSAQGPAPGTPGPFTPQYAVIPEPGTEEAIPLELVPLAARAVAQQAANQYVEGAAIASATLDTQGSLPVFELAGTGAGGQAFEVDVFAEGKIEEIELALSPGQELPQAVTEAVEAYLPNFSPDQVMWSLRPQPSGLSEISYVLSGVNAAGTAVEIAVREDGAKVHIEQDIAEDGGTPGPSPSATTGTATALPTTVTTTTPTVETPTVETTTPTVETPTVETPTVETTTPVTGTETPTVETTTPVTGTETPTDVPGLPLP